jgi:hypothetical protein
MQYSYRVVAASVGYTDVLGPKAFFDQCKDMDEPDAEGTLTLTARSGSDGIAATGTEAELFDLLARWWRQLSDKVGGPRLMTVLDLATNHLPEDVSANLSSYDGVTAIDTVYGWLLTVPSNIEEHVREYGEPPAAVVDLWKCARRFGARLRRRPRRRPARVGLVTMTTIIHLDASTVGVQLWSADDIREDLPEAAAGLTGEHVGVLLHDSNGDGQLLVGTEQQVIDRLQQAIELIRRERAILDSAAPPPAALPMLVLDDTPLSDAQCEVLRDHVEPAAAAGDCDWIGGAAYMYAIEKDVTVGGVSIPRGVYLRTIHGGDVRAWQVLAGPVARYIRGVQAAFLADTERG